MSNTHTSKPWWREPWPWILMAGPAIAVLGCTITIVLATKGFEAQNISDGGRKQGLLVSKPLSAATPSDQKVVPVE